MGISTSFLNSRLAGLNQNILNDIKDITFKEKTYKSTLDLKSKTDNITQHKKILMMIGIDMKKVKESLLLSNNVINNYNVTNQNLKKLITMYSYIYNKLTPPPLVTQATTQATTQAPANNVPIALPTTKITNVNKKMITSSDASQLYNTIEGFTDYISAYYNNMPIIEGLSDTDITNTKTLMTKEKELLDQLVDFNMKYQRYIHCNDPNVNTDCASDNYPSAQELITKMNKINDILGSMDRTIISNNTDFEQNHYNILGDYENVVNLRYDLDMKVKQLYDPENSKIADFKNSYDSTIYSGIIVSALATSMLYYIFTEL
jgi:hypothetical protein